MAESALDKTDIWQSHQSRLDYWAAVMAAEFNQVIPNHSVVKKAQTEPEKLFLRWLNSYELFRDNLASDERPNKEGILKSLEIETNEILRLLKQYKDIKKSN